VQRGDHQIKDGRDAFFFVIGGPAPSLAAGPLLFWRPTSKPTARCNPDKGHAND
jgi:hypothetical protein